MTTKRCARINSLLREVIADVIRFEVRNPHVTPMVSVTKVEVSADLKYAKVYVSMIGTDLEKKKMLQGLKSGAGFIGKQAAEKVVLRYFPSLIFKLDESLAHQEKIEKLIQDIHEHEKTENS